jgi:hypothetical protein
MPITVPTCPRCGAALVAARFASTAVCSYCGATARIDPTAVSAQRFHDAWRTWNEPAPGNDDHRVSIGDTHWTIDRLLAHGEISDVFVARRARWPTELVILKTLRDGKDAPLLEQEWRALETLHHSPAAEGMHFAVRAPFPIVRDQATSVYRWAPGFVHTFEAVRSAYPDGIPAVSSIWVWRRILEILSVMRRAGLAHGAVLPNHVLVEEGEHGVRLVGFSCAGAPGSPLSTVSARWEGFYPNKKLSIRADITMSARCIAYLLGGSGRDGEVPDHVPAPLAELLRRSGGEDGDKDDDPWTLRGRVGEVAQSLFGPPAFHPITMA